MKARHTTKAEETPEFKEFWEDIWRPHMNPFDGRGDARDCFFQHVEVLGADPRDIVDGARWFIRSGGNQGIGRDGKPVRIHAASWLNKTPYEDGCEQERTYQARLAEAQAKRTQPAPKPLPEPIETEDRAAIARRVFEKLGVRSEGMH